MSKLNFVVAMPFSIQKLVKFAFFFGVARCVSNKIQILV